MCGPFFIYVNVNIVETKSDYSFKFGNNVMPLQSVYSRVLNYFWRSQIAYHGIFCMKADSFFHSSAQVLFV